MLIYFAGPLFSNAEKSYNERIVLNVEKEGFKVFFPQRDGFETKGIVKDDVERKKIRNNIFELDKSKVYESDIFLFILDGRIPDEGACVELGLAYSHKELVKSERKIIGFQSDLRTSFIRNKLNPMVETPFDMIIENDENRLIKELSAIRDKYL